MSEHFPGLQALCHVLRPLHRLTYNARTLPWETRHRPPVLGRTPPRATTDLSYAALLLIYRFLPLEMANPRGQRLLAHRYTNSQVLQRRTTSLGTEAQNDMILWSTRSSVMDGAVVAHRRLSCH